MHIRGRAPEVLLYHGDAKKGANERNLTAYDIISATTTQVRLEFAAFNEYARAFFMRTRTEAEKLQTARHNAANGVVEGASSQAHPVGKEKMWAAQDKASEPLVRGHWPLANIEYNILVIDKVHKTGQMETDLFKSIMHIEAKFVAAVGATRLQNRYSELLPLCMLIRLEPLNDPDLF